MTEDGSYSTVCKLCGKVKKTYKTYKIKSVTLSKTEYIYNKKTAKPSATVRDIKGNILENGTDYTVKYPEKSILPGSYTVKITLKGKYSGSVKLSFTIAPRTVKNVKTVSSSAGKAKVIYTAVTGATGYEVFYSTGKTGPYKKLASTKTTSYTRSGLTRGRTYYFKIRAYKYSGGERIYGGFSKASRVTVI